MTRGPRQKGPRPFYIGANVMVAVLMIGTIPAPDPVDAVLLIACAVMFAVQLNHRRAAKWYTAGTVVWAIEELHHGVTLFLLAMLLISVALATDLQDNDDNDKDDGLPAKNPAQKTRTPARSLKPAPDTTG